MEKEFSILKVISAIFLQVQEITIQSTHTSKLLQIINFQDCVYIWCQWNVVFMQLEYKLYFFMVA